MSDVPVGPDALLAGRYRLAEPIGYGGMATVYRATDERLGRDVAVKVFRRDVAEAVDLQRIQREVRILAAVQSPYVVTVFDAVESDVPGLAYLVLELVEGSDLRTLIDRPRRPSADFVRRIVADVASALDALHAQGIVHRDVKPANVLVLAGANRRQNSIAAKLSDFGIAQSVDSTRLTATNFILGTAAYLSPEQVRGARLKPATDVYSLGLMLIEALTGKPAFPGPVAESAAARLARPPQLPRNASPALADLLSRMTAIDPGERPRAGEVAAALHDLAGGMTVPKGATAQTAAVPQAPAMPLGAAAHDIGEPTALAERPKRRRTNTAPVGLGAAAAAAAMAAAPSPADAAGAEEPPEGTAPRPPLPQDEVPTAQSPLPEAGGEPPVVEAEGVELLERELPPAALAAPTAEQTVGRFGAHPRTTVLATLAACVLLVGTGSVVLASTGGPILAGANETSQAPVAALMDPSAGTGAGSGTSSAATPQQLEAQRRTEDLILTMGAREAGIADTPPLLPPVSPSPSATAAPRTTGSSTETSASTTTSSSTPTHSSTPTATPTHTPTATATPTPSPTRTSSTPTPSETTTSTPTDTPTSTPTTSTPTTSTTPPETDTPTSAPGTSSSTSSASPGASSGSPGASSGSPDASSKSKDGKKGGDKGKPSGDESTSGTGGDEG